MKTLQLTLIALFLSFYSNAQLSGDLTIGGSSPDYISLSDAVADINAQGMDASVNFILRDGNYDGPWGLSFIDGMNEDRTITFSSESADSAAVIISSSTLFDTNYMWNIGVDNNLKFENLTFHLSGPNEDYVGGLGTLQGAWNFELQGCHFITDTPEYTWYLEAFPVKDLTIENSRFENVESLMYFSSGGNNANFINNTFICHDDAIDLEGFDEIVIRDNHFLNGLVFWYGEPYYYGDYCTTVEGNISKLTVEGNLYEGNGMTILDVYESPIDSVFIRNNEFQVEEGEIYLELPQYVLFENNTNSASYELEFDGCKSINILNSECNYVEIYDGAGEINVRNNQFYSSVYSNGALDIYSFIIESGLEGIIESNLFKGSEQYQDSGVQLDQIVMNNGETFKIFNNSIMNSEEPIEIVTVSDVEIKFNSISSNLDLNEFVDGSGVSNIEISNNIIYLSEDLISGEIYDFSASSSINIHDNVYFWNDDAQIDFMEFDGVNYNTLPEAQGAGYAINAQFTDPEYYDPLSDLRICNQELQGTGVTDANVPNDYFDFVRADPPTPGFYEFVELDAGFTFFQDENNFQFTAINTNAAQDVVWNFGDGGTSTDPNPNYTFDELGEFTVSLLVSNPCGVETTNQTVTIISIGVDELNTAVFAMFPNPTNGNLTVEFNNPAVEKLVIMDFQGRIVLEENMSGKINLDVSHLSKGMYLVYGTDASEQIVSSGQKLVVE